LRDLIRRNRRASVALHFAIHREMVRLMTLRTLPLTMAPPAIAQIDARLTAIGQQQGVAIPFAIESGSRAWGFPSPNSDYDCRFVFVRQPDDYLSPWPRRDVIETPLEGDLDVNGWDLAKAVRLLAGGNAVIIEWLMSPVIYRAEEQFREEFLALARRVADRHLVARHYLHLGERFRDACLAADGAVSRKKILYALRPAAALRWLRLHGEAVAPMYLPALLAECDPPAGLAQAVEGLIARKAEAAENDSEPLPGAVAAFIGDELEAAREAFQKRPPSFGAEARRDAEAFFRATVRRLAVSSPRMRGS
jgi:predicted nucleotidyltransferase